MAFPWAAAVGAAGVVGGLFNKGGKGKNYRRDASDIINRYRSERPEGYTTEGDIRESERFRSRRSGTVGSLGRQQRAGVIRRFASRGLGGSPASESVMRRIGKQEGAAVEGIGREAESRLYGTRMGREKFEQDRLMTAFGADLGALEKSYDMDARKNAAFWNRMSSYFPTLLSFYGGEKGGGKDNILGPEGQFPGGGEAGQM